MATYQLVGSQDPASRIDRVEVESPTDENPDGKVLVLNGEPKELSDDQYSKLSRHVRLQPVPESEVVEVKFVDQPGVEMPSQSTDVPPDPGTTPDVKSMDRSALLVELARVRAKDPAALPELTDKSKVADLSAGLSDYHGLEA